VVGETGDVLRLPLRPTRLLALGAIVLVAVLYWRPMRTYLRTKHELQVQQAQVHALRAERERLQRMIAEAGTSPELIRQARRLGLVKPGERLFIVRGIAAWRRLHHSR
jgi:hypothetical protein